MQPRKISLLLAMASILLWSSFATIGSKLATVPLYFLVGSSLGIGALPALKAWRRWFQQPGILLFGTASIFGYHCLLLEALRRAPAIEANLLNYLWPVLIILFSAWLLPKHSLRIAHIAGGLLAFAGAASVIAGEGLAFRPQYAFGYALALGAALVWALYSVLTKKLPPFSTEMVGGFCFCSALLALALHFCLEEPVSLEPGAWKYILYLGVGPMGSAFYCWDAAIKRGDPRLIGALSYLTPVLSTAFLAVAERGQAVSVAHLLALALILGGAVISSYARP